MKKSIIKNYLYNMSYQILVVIVPLLTTPYLSRVLGAEAIGIYSYTLSICTYFILFGTLGISLYGQREIAYVQENIKKRSIIFWEIIILRCITLLISIIIFYFTFCLENNYKFYYKILILELVANIVDISWYFQGLEEFKKNVIRNTVVKLLSVVCIFLVVKSVEDLYKYFIIYVLSNFIGNISLWKYMPKYLEKIKISELNVLQHFKPTLGLFIPQLAIQIYTVLDKTMIGAIIPDKSETGFYEQSQKIVKLLLSIVTSLGAVMVPRISSTYAKGKTEQVRNYIINSFNIVFLLAFPLIFGIVLISENFVPIFYGQGYEKVAILIKVISPIILIIGISNVIGHQYLIPTKRQKEFSISVTIGAIVNFILNFILINYMGAIGASIATVIAELVVTFTQIYFVKNEFDFNRIKKIATNYIFASIFMFFVCTLIGIYVTSNIVSIFLQIIIGILVYFGFLIFIKDNFFIRIINSLKKNKGGFNEKI